MLVLVLGVFLAANRWLPVEHAYILATGLTILLLVAGEARWGRDQPTVDGPSRRTDLVYALSAPVVPGLASAGATLLALRFTSHPASSWPLWVQGPVGFAVGELTAYWVHRGVHRVDLLYRFHEVHHSSRALHWLNASRFHPLDTALFQLTTVVPLVLLGFAPEAIAVVGLLGQTGTFLQHTRIPVDGRGWSRVFHTSLAHRIHHRDGSAPIRNFGSMLLLWDWVFGTYEAPDPGARPPLGPGRRFPERWTQQLVEPFRGRS